MRYSAADYCLAVLAPALRNSLGLKAETHRCCLSAAGCCRTLAGCSDHSHPVQWKNGMLLRTCLLEAAATAVGSGADSVARIEMLAVFDLMSGSAELASAPRLLGPSFAAAAAVAVVTEGFRKGREIL
jgi:hypothetical protein